MSIKRIISERLSFLQLLLIICVLIVVPLMAGVAWDSYYSTSEEYQKNFDILKKNTEQSIIEMVQIVDDGLVVYDLSLDEQMKKGFEPFLEAYRESGGDPSQIDLEEIRQGLGGRYHLYIIDKEHRIIDSTMDSDIGLDFSFLDEFSAHLDTVREGDSYSGDRVTKGIRAKNNTRKYAYYPTPDHKYILELSYEIEKNSTRSLLQFKKNVEDLMEMNPYLVSVRIYDILGDTIGDPEEPDSKLREFIRDDIIREKNDYVIEDVENGTITNYRYVNLAKENIGSDTSLAIAFTYSTEMLDKNIMSAWYNDLLSTAGMGTLLIIILFFFCSMISRPIKNLEEDVDKISMGNLDHPIRTGTGGREFTHLEASISNMVERLRISINKLQESEELIRKHNEELEEIVSTRTKEALDRSDEANFYLDIITHDINNSNMAALGYAEILSEISDEEGREIAKMLIAAIHQNDDIIRNISLMRKLRDKEQISLFPVSLDSIVNHAISLFPLNVVYDGTNLRVMADNLLGEVFTNILGNSVRHAGQGCEVKISVRELDGNVEVCISDNGPGIPEDMKEECFNRYSKNLSGRKASGSGVGLFIVKKLVTERYGGSAMAYDAVERHPENGLMICIILKKALS